MTPFKAIYGYPPPRVLDYVAGTTRVGAVDLLLKGRQQLLSLLKQNLCAAQERMRWFADKKRVERSFAVGDWVHLRLQSYKQFSMHHKKLGKLAPRYYGPFQVIQRIGEVSYKLDLPSGSLIHLVFHVSCLKAKLGDKVVPRPTLPAVNADLVPTPELMLILDKKSIQLRSRIMTQVLVLWQGECKEDATWEILYDLQAKFPHFMGKVL